METPFSNFGNFFPFSGGTISILVSTGTAETLRGTRGVEWTVHVHPCPRKKFGWTVATLVY